MRKAANTAQKSSRQVTGTTRSGALQAIPADEQGQKREQQRVGQKCLMAVCDEAADARGGQRPRSDMHPDDVPLKPRQAPLFQPADPVPEHHGGLQRIGDKGGHHVALLLLRHKGEEQQGKSEPAQQKLVVRPLVRFFSPADPASAQSGQSGKRPRPAKAGKER